MTSRVSTSNKIAIAAAGLVVFGGGAYMYTQAFPPSGGTVAGTISPAQRYRASQVSAADVQLGDNSVPRLMQTDAFQAMVKNPSFRAMARDPEFSALAQNSSALAAMSQHAAAFQSLASNRQQFQSLVAMSSAMNALS